MKLSNKGLILELGEQQDEIQGEAGSDHRTGFTIKYTIGWINDSSAN